MPIREFTMRTKAVALNTSSGTQDITWSDCAGMTAKGVEIAYSGVTDYSTSSNKEHCYGFGDGTTQVSWATWETDAADPTVVQSGLRNDSIIHMYNGSGTLIRQVTVDSMIDGGVRLDIQSGYEPAAGNQAIVTCYFGTELNVDVGTQNISGSGTQTCTTGFKPDIIKTINPYIFTPNTTSALARGSVGIGLDHPVDGLKQYCVCFFQKDNVATTNIGGGFRSDRLFEIQGETSSTPLETGYLSACNSTNFQFTVGSDWSGLDIGWLALGLPASVSFNYHNVNLATTVTTQTFTESFTPMHIMGHTANYSTTGVSRASPVGAGWSSYWYTGEEDSGPYTGFSGWVSPDAYGAGQPAQDTRELFDTTSYGSDYGFFRAFRWAGSASNGYLGINGSDVEIDTTTVTTVYGNETIFVVLSEGPIVGGGTYKQNMQNNQRNHFKQAILTR